MNEQDAIHRLNVIAAVANDPNYPGRDDMESWHEEADAILIAFLRASGFASVADAWEAIEGKWYA